MHDVTYKGNFVSGAFLSIEEGLVRAAKSSRKEVGTRQEKIPTSGKFFPLITFFKRQKCRNTMVRNPNNFTGKPSLLIITSGKLFL